MPEITTFLGFFIRMMLSVLLGAIIGTERELTKHYAGIVTNIIVCVGALLLFLILPAAKMLM